MLDGEFHQRVAAMDLQLSGDIAIFDSAVWHGHTSNSTSKARRSIQGYFVRRSAGQAMHFSGE